MTARRPVRTAANQACVSPRLAMSVCVFFFFNDTATTEIYTLSLHDALPILVSDSCRNTWSCRPTMSGPRSEEHTSELQSRFGISYAVFCLKKKKHTTEPTNSHELQCALHGVSTRVGV